MSVAIPETRSISPPQDLSERIALARYLFQAFYGRCFWHSPSDLEITEDHIPFVIKGLRANGGRIGFMLAGKLRAGAYGQDPLKCR